MATNPFDAAAKQVAGDVGGVSLYTVQGRNADDVARSNKAAKILGLPPELVDADLPALEQRVRMAQAREAMAKDPKLAAWASNPRNAAIAADDFENLKRISEARAKQYGTLQAPVPSAPTVGNFFSGVGTTFVESFRQIREGLRVGASDLLFPDDRQTQRMQEQSFREIEGSQWATQRARPAFKSRTMGGIYSGVSSAAQMAPAIGIGVLGGPVAGLTAVGAQVAPQAYGKYRARGGTPGEAALGAGGEAAVEVATEALPMGFIVSRFGKVGFGPFVAGLLGRDIPTEQIATFAQDAIDTAIANPDKTWGEFLQERPDAAYDTLVSTVVQGVLVGGPSAVANRLGERGQAEQAEGSAAFLDELAGVAQESKVRQRDGSAFADYLERQLDGTGSESIAIPAEKVRELYQTNDIDWHSPDDPFFGFDDSMAEQIDQALATGGDVVVKTADFVTHLAGTPAWEALKDHVRTSPGGMSRAEAQEFSGAFEDAMRQTGEQLAEQMEADRVAMEPRQKIAERVRDKLMLAGFRPDTAMQYAELTAARYATRATRMGQELTGNEADALEIRQVLPEKLAKVTAVDGLDLVIEAMKRGKAQRSDRQKFGPSLLEFIAERGGVEDVEGDLSAMGADAWHKDRRFRKKLVLPKRDRSPDMLGDVAGNANTPDAVAMAAWEAGYFPDKGETRPTVDDLYEAIRGELAGQTRYSDERVQANDELRAAADELAAILDQRGLDAETASAKEIKETIAQYQAERSFEQPAYHGSPHIFDRFSTEAIGTGEGAQVFGWGLYFAGRKEIAEFYRDQLARQNVTYRWNGEERYLDAIEDELIAIAKRAGGGGVGHDTAVMIAANITDAAAEGDSMKDMLSFVRKSDWAADTKAAWAAALVAADQNMAVERKAGRLYHVEIPEDDEYLLWDKPLSEQPQSVKIAIARIPDAAWDQIAERLDDMGMNPIEPDDTEYTGRELYQALTRIELDVPTDGSNAQQDASLALHEAGIAGIKYLDQGSRSTGDGSYNYVVFDDSRVAIRSFEQSFMDRARGRITFGGGKSIIELFESRDLSTFIHESGHLYLEELRADAMDPAASDQLKADWQIVQDWFAANGHAFDGEIPTEAHELWARGFERFAMEGKAPSTALRKVFDAFKRWLLTIYQVVDNLRSPITPDIRGVMERLIATDEEIAAARQEQNIDAMFTSAADAGMTDAEFAEYRRTAEESRDEAHDALLYRTMAAVRSAKTKAWKDEESSVRAEVTERIDRQPMFRALRLLTGTDSAKLSRQWLIDNYGEDALSLLPKRVPPLYRDTKTAHADEIAEMSGFASGDDMVKQLMGLEQAHRQLREAGDKRTVRQAQIDQETQATMLDRHGDILNDGTIEDEAKALIHNDKQGEVIASEIRSLARRANKRPTPYAVARRWAAERIAGSKVVEATSGSALQRYERAARRAAKLAEEAMLKGDVEETYRQKQAQMLNNALITEAWKAKEQVETAVRRLAKVARRKTSPSIDQDYLEQAHGLLEQVELRSRSQTSIERQTSFEEWAAAQQVAGHDVVVPPSFATSLGTTHWSRLRVGQLIGLDETVQQILHLGRLKQKLIDAKEERDFNEVVGEAIAAVSKLPPKAPSDLMDATWRDRFKAGVANADAALLKMETIVDWLDSKNSNGVFNRIVFKPIAEAQAKEGDLFAEYMGKLAEHMAAVPRETLKRWGDRVTVPELINRDTNNPFTLSRQQLIAMALNMGNEGNAQRLADGYGWNEAAIMQALNRELNEAEWRYVQSVWDTIDGLWPDIDAMERRVNGIAPDKVDARPLETSAGTLRGGYYPAVYDSTRDYQAEHNAGRESDLFESHYTRATTRASATKERADQVKRPILLDLSVISRHVGEVIHDITHREAVMNADKFLSDKRIMKAVDQSLGPAARKQFRPWLKFVANQWAMERAGNEGIGAFMNKLRSNATVVGMGFRFTTMMMQGAGYSNAFEVVGVKWVAAGVAQSLRNPLATWQFIKERSGEMRHRMDTLDRDIAAGIKRMAGKANPLTEARRFAFHGIGYMDRMVVIPTWIGAYNKALASGETEEAAIYAADKVVRQSQGAGAAKDMAAVMRGTGQWGQALKLMTMFYSYVSAVYQRQRTFGRDVRHAKTGDIPGLMARAWWLIVVPPLLSELMAGRGPDEDEDWGWWAFKSMFAQSVGAVPLVRDLTKPIFGAFEGKNFFDYQLSPIQRAGQAPVEVARELTKAAKGEDTTNLTRDTLETVGYWTGLVPGQIAASTQFLVDVGYGEQDPETVGDWWEGLTKGKIEAE